MPFRHFFFRQLFFGQSKKLTKLLFMGKIRNSKRKITASATENLQGQRDRKVPFLAIYGA